MRNTYLIGCGMAAIACLAPLPAAAQDTGRRVVHLPAQPLAASLRTIAHTFDRSVAVDAALVTGRTAPALDGEMSFDEAIAGLLADSGLEAVTVGNGIAIRAIATSAANEGDITVTGTRIRGAVVASTTIRVDREAMRNAGQSSAADMFRALPQNFGGGQNVGIGANVPEGKGADLAGGSSVNLRGLGSDATLTLLDGRRLSYDGALQSVDVSAIPFGAIERIDVVPDGASALFGSDAVAGVVNILLRRDFNGLETSGRVAGSTDGGNFQQQYGATAGRVWSSGSALLAYEYARSTPIMADQRSYAATRTPGVTLFPYLRHHNAALTLRQEIVPGLTFDLDGLYNTRWHALSAPLDPSGNLSISRFEGRNDTESWTLAPSFKLVLPGDWQATLAGSYGWNRVRYGGTYFFGPTTLDAGSGAYRNTAENVELSGNGKVVDLPGGAVKLAVGAGFRRNGFERLSSRGAAERIERGQDSVYGFAELSLPLIGPAQKVPLVDRLDLSIAARYERYPGLATVVTPKFGIIYAPTPDVSLKGSWGRSFRAATLYEQYSPRTALLYDAATLGGAGAGGATAILLVGGNPGLKPERSTNWSATLAIHPRALAGAELEISWFDVRYRDRIVTPILFESMALSDPRYRDRVTSDPTPGMLAAALAQAASFINASSGGYDPAGVVAIIDNSNVNAGRQAAHGVDVLGRYKFALGGGSLSTTLNLSWLDSRQQISPELPVTRLAGVLFNPPHLRGRGEVGWTGGALTVTAALNYIGPVRDTRVSPAPRIAGMAPVDLTLRYRRSPGRRLLDGIDIIASAQNLLNAKPAPIATRLFMDTPYDSTNYSPFGRVLSLTVTKSW
ncbi:TonB-dependent receptor [Sphingomonas sp. ERG5]|uniref:TonB-dependent receptor n=1 Tax=Sphingomonas sp. ERG5 TaxID=1381597 RepID=UPI00068CEBCA|nr:TonB-dependent receptor [Sphingomonas sp. ERG5]